jgi:hypothetical protein
MIESENFELLEDCAVYRPVGRVSLSTAVQWMTSIITSCRERGIRKLMVDIYGLTGFESPPLHTRYFFMHEWAGAAAGAVCIAMVARPEMIDPEKFGVMVGRNAGLTCDVFATEPEAEAWLRSVKCNKAARPVQAI